LTLVRKIVELHFGTVEAQSDGPERGSTFLVRLPCLKAGMPTPLPQSTEPCDSAEPSIAAHSILIVDDNRDAADSLGRYLTGLGHEVHVAYDGPSALAETRIQIPDVVLLDIGLPGLDGYEVARRMRSQAGLELTRFAALTGYGSESDRLLSEHAGFEAHLTKPIDLDALKNFLHGAETVRAG
jgi:CheY-like chemotaxis protein